MSTSTNTGLFVGPDNTFSVIHDLEYATAVDDEIIIQVLYSGINPADTKHSQYLGIVDTVIGYDFCGRVVDAGSSSFSAGDIVAGMTPTGVGRPKRYGSHQDYLACPKDMVWSVPSQLPQHHAAALSVVVATAADAIFNLYGLLPPGDASAGAATVQDKGPILIWGGSSSVGVCAIQLARAAGCREIFVTASPQRHGLLKALGATACFDYASTDVVDEITTKVRDLGADFRFALDAVGTPASAKQVESCCSGDSTVLVSTTQTFGRFQMPFATRNCAAQIRIPGTQHLLDIPAHAKATEAMRKVTLWAVTNYGREFTLPKVEVIHDTAERSLEKVQEVVKNGSFGKVVLQHPYRR